MNEIPLSVLWTTLGILLLMSAFFSGSETGMLSLNRYRLRHLVKKKKRGAAQVEELLSRPDRLIGMILIGNNFVNTFAAAIATIIALRLWGENSIAAASAVLALVVVLVVGEVTPKTLAALRPEQVAFVAVYVLKPLMTLMYPLVWLMNTVCNGILRAIGVAPDEASSDHLSREELRTLVNESGAVLPKRHKSMLLSILDLEDVTVDDIMIPKHEVMGIDLEEDLDDIIQFLRSAQHTRLPVYKSDLNAPVGVLHLRKISRLLMDNELNKAKILQQAVEPYFVPEGTPLHLQLLNFQKVKRRLGFVVDEYGDVQGIVTLEDILEEIVGEFTTDFAASSQDIHPQEDGSYFIDGLATIRDINKALKWNLPSKGPKTLNGLITEHLEHIPEHNLCLKVGSYLIETIQIKENLVKTARVINTRPPRKKSKAVSGNK